MVETQKQIEELKQTYLSWSLHDRDVRHEGMKEGISIGEKRGEERAKLEAARNMLMEGDSAEKIARCTDLTLETVQKLAEQLKVPAAQ